MTAEAKDVLVIACEANANAAKHADNADELEAFRNAAARAGDSYKHLARENFTAGDPRRDMRVDAALDALVETLAARAAHDRAREVEEVGK